jgi:hypothetical protein
MVVMEMAMKGFVFAYINGVPAVITSFNSLSVKYIEGFNLKPSYKDYCHRLEFEASVVM